MKIMFFVENIVWACVFIAILLLLDGWGKMWAIVPIFALNTKFSGGKP